MLMIKWFFLKLDDFKFFVGLTTLIRDQIYRLFTDDQICNNWLDQLTWWKLYVRLFQVLIPLNALSILVSYNPECAEKSECSC